MDSSGTDASNGEKFLREVLASRGDEQNLRENALKGSENAGGERSSGRAEQHEWWRNTGECGARKGPKHMPGVRNPIP